jgi:hypothetical protein
VGGEAGRLLGRVEGGQLHAVCIPLGKGLQAPIDDCVVSPRPQAVPTHISNATHRKARAV